MIVKLPLFISVREWLLFIVSITIIFCINLYSLYNDYKEFKAAKYTTLKVINQYVKTKSSGREYYVLRLKADNYSFYTTNYSYELPDLKNRYVNLKIDTKKVTFIDFLRGFYAPTYALKPLEIEDNYYKVYKYITSQHESVETKEFFSAIFLASSLSKDIRESIAVLGVSHLVAISGFHLGILSLFIYFVLLYPYKFFQQKYFPYRSAKIDITIFSIVVLFVYMYFVDFVPSLLRSFVMMVIGFYLYVRYIKILSFTTLFVAILFLVAFFPNLLFSVSFWFSVSGVFYVYLYFHYFYYKKLLYVVLFNFWIFLAMIPIAHYYFGIFSIYQLFSPLLSLSFIIFYPFEIILHLIGLPTLLDFVLNWLLKVEDIYVVIKTPLWFLVIYVATSLASIAYKKAFIFLNLLIMLFFSYCIYYYFT